MFGYTEPDKAKIIINVWALRRDPAVWSNAGCFQPERFISSFDDFKGINFEFIPFGAGRKTCPGISFASVNIELALARLLYHFDWKLSNSATPEELYMPKIFGASSRRDKNLCLIGILYVPFS